MSSTRTSLSRAEQNMVMPESFEPWVVMMLPPGGFFMIGALLLVANWHDLKKLARERAKEKAHAPAGAIAGKPKEREVAIA